MRKVILESLREEVSKAGLLPLRKEETEEMSRQANAYTQRGMHIQACILAYIHTCIIYMGMHTYSRQRWKKEGRGRRGVDYSEYN